LFCPQCAEFIENELKAGNINCDEGKDKMYNDIDCPYCGEGNEINHDDGYGYEENKTHEQECSHCGKIFVYTTSINFHYEPEQAPCKNGGEHDWEQMHGAPEEYFKNRQRCSYCDEERTI